MPRESFEQKLRDLEDELLVLGSMVEKAIMDSIQVLDRRDMDAARALIAEDRVINRKRYDVEGTILVLIATQQPMARDLRALASMLEITTELERIGDYAKGIARISIMLGEGPLIKPLIDIPRMAELACKMLRQALDAFIRRDVALARAIPEQDDEVDDLYNQVYRELLDLIIADQSNTEPANLLLWAAHNLERAADRVTNICERVLFTVTGQMIEMDLEDEIESLG